jgi:hypothetical protein
MHEAALLNLLGATSCGSNSIPQLQAGQQDQPPFANDSTIFYLTTHDLWRTMHDAVLPLGREVDTEARKLSSGSQL